MNMPNVEYNIYKLSLEFFPKNLNKFGIFLENKHNFFFLFFLGKQLNILIKILIQWPPLS